MPAVVKVYYKMKSQQFVNEATFYKAMQQNGLNHPHIIDCMAQIPNLKVQGETEAKPVIIQEFAKKGNLLDNLEYI